MPHRCHLCRRDFAKAAHLRDHITAAHGRPAGKAPAPAEPRGGMTRATRAYVTDLLGNDVEPHNPYADLLRLPSEFVPSDEGLRHIETLGQAVMRHMASRHTQIQNRTVTATAPAGGGSIDSWGDPVRTRTPPIEPLTIEGHLVDE